MDKIEVTPYSYDILRIAPNNFTELLRITPTGEVIAPSLEAASEAGRYFVQSMRGHLEVMREAIRAEILATRTDATPVAWMYERKHDGHKEIRVDYLEVSPRVYTVTPIYPHPPATDVAALVEENKRLRDEWQFLADLLDKNFSENDQPNRVMWHGEWHEGPLAEAYHATFNAVRRLALAALAPFTKGQNDE